MTAAKPSSGTDVQHWHPFTEMFPWNSRLGQLFENMWHVTAHEGLAPGAELEESDDGFTLEMDLPGVAKDDVTIDVVGRRVAVRGTRKERSGAALCALDAGHGQRRLRGDLAGRCG
jgi:HSP20 family protein